MLPTGPIVKTIHILWYQFTFYRSSIFSRHYVKVISCYYVFVLRNIVMLLSHATVTNLGDKLWICQWWNITGYRWFGGSAYLSTCLWTLIEYVCFYVYTVGRGFFVCLWVCVAILFWPFCFYLVGLLSFNLKHLFMSKYMD